MLDSERYPFTAVDSRQAEAGFRPYLPLTLT